MLVRRPDRPQSPLAPSRPNGTVAPYPVSTPRNPGTFEGWGPKL
jgi:hypothetical protein